MYYISDSNPNSISSHTIEVRKGFDTCGRLIVTPKDGEYIIESLFTKSDHRGQGLGKMLVSHVEENYGKVAIESANDGFWQSMGYEKCADSHWRKQDTE